MAATDGILTFELLKYYEQEKKDIFCIILKLFTALLHMDTPKQICKHLQLSCLHHCPHETQR